MEERSMVQECSSVVIPIVLLNFRTREEGGEGREKKNQREDVTSYQKENPVNQKS